MKTLKISLVFCIFTFCTLQAYATAHANYLYEASKVLGQDNSMIGTLLFAENGEGSESDVQSGDLVIPAANENEEKKKLCVSVCNEWGKDCIISPRTGTRKCRRMCKSFGKECV